MHLKFWCFTYILIVLLIIFCIHHFPCASPYLSNECRTRFLYIQHRKLGGDLVNTSRPRQNDRLFADDIFKRIFLNENIRISIQISLMFILNGPIYNIPALVQIMAWCRPGDKTLSEPMLARSLTHICVTRPQWVNIVSLLETRDRGFCLNGSSINHSKYFITFWKNIVTVGMSFCQNWNASSNKNGMLLLSLSRVFNISRTLVGNKIVDYSDVVGASPVGAAPTTSSFST